MSGQELDKLLIKEARELQEFFIGTYADEALEDARYFWAVDHR